MRGSVRTQDIGRLKRRADFLHVGKGRRWHGKSVSLQAARRDEDSLADEAVPDPTPRVGFTLTKKVGCAVIRNRARRRIKEALRLMRDVSLQPDYDYVFIGRLDAIRLSFDDLGREMARAIAAVHDDTRPASRRPGGTGPRITRVKP